VNARHIPRQFRPYWHQRPVRQPVRWQLRLALAVAICIWLIA
jgi:hypothetical protein